MNDYNEIVDKLLDMNPDPIPKFILLKDFKNIDQKSTEYQTLYDEVCNHKFVRNIDEARNERGFWAPFHGKTEGNIRKLISYGLENEHPSLKKLSEYLIKVLQENESWDQFEKQDNPLWWPKIFVPLVTTTMLSLIDPSNNILVDYRNRWGNLADKAFTQGVYDSDTYASSFISVFQVQTKRVIEPFNYYVLLLLAPYQGNQWISDFTQHRLVDYFINEATGLYYVYNNRPGECIPIDSINRDSRDFWHWIHSLSIIAQYAGWNEREDKYIDWIMSQRNADGLWEFPKKFDFTLSNTWRGKSKVIDSSIYVLKLLLHKKGY